MVSKKHIIYLLSGTFAAVTGALLLRRYQRQKRRAIEEAKQKKLKKYEQEQEFINEILVLLWNRQQNLLQKIDDFISKNYEDTQVPSFKLLLLKLDVIFQKPKLSPEYEQAVTKTLKQMNEYIHQRKTKRVMNADDVANPFEHSLAEQEFAVHYYTTLVDELKAANPEYMKRLRKEVSQAYKKSPHLLLLKEKMAEHSIGTDAMNLVAELVEEYKKDVKQHRTKLATSYGTLARMASSSTTKLELLNLDLELIPDADAFLQRFMLYKTELQKIPRTPEMEEAVQSFEAYAQDLEKAWLHHGKPKKVLMQVAKLGEDVEVFSKYHDLFFKYNADIHDDVLAGFYKFYVYKQGKIDEFIAMLDTRKAHYSELAASNPENEKFMFKSWMFNDNHALYKSDAVLHKLEFAQCLELLQSKSNSLNTQQDIEGSEVVVEIVRSLQTAFSRYPVLSKLFYETRDEVLKNNKILPFDTYFQRLSRIELRNNNPDDVMSIIIAINFILMAWTILPDVTFVTHAVGPAFFDNYIRNAIKKAKFTRGEHIFMLVAFPNYVVPSLGTRPLELIYSSLRQKLEREEQQILQLRAATEM